MRQTEQELIDAIVRSTRDLQQAIARAAESGLKVRIDIESEYRPDKIFPIPVIIPSVERSTKLL